MAFEKNTPADEVTDQVIAMAWADRISFEEIKKKHGLSEAEVIVTMRRNLKPASFRRWRARVSGRGTKHLKRFRVGRERL